MPRIEPVAPPYEPDVAERLEAMMPPGVPPIRLFRTFAESPDGHGHGRLGRLRTRQAALALDAPTARSSSIAPVRDAAASTSGVST